MNKKAYQQPKAKAYELKLSKAIMQTSGPIKTQRFVEEEGEWTKEENTNLTNAVNWEE